DASAQLLFRRLAANLGFLERPILNAKGLTRWQGNIVREDFESRRIYARPALRHRTADLTFGEQAGAFHHVNRVGVELAGDAGFGFVLAEAEHPQPGNE